jgi:hypothetical protein
MGVAMDDSTYQLLQIVPFLLISIPFAIGNGYLASRLGRNALIWVILSLIPLVNYVFFIYVAYQIVFFVVDRLSSTTKEVEA